LLVNLGAVFSDGALEARFGSRAVAERPARPPYRWRKCLVVMYLDVKRNRMVPPFRGYAPGGKMGPTSTTSPEI